MDWKGETKRTYDDFSREYERLRNRSFTIHSLDEDFSLFYRNLDGNKVLDLGSGPGEDSLRMKEKGLKPVCIDISEAMMEICREKGLEGYKMDMEHLEFEEDSFDGIWARTSLLHVPKERIEHVLRQIKKVLKPEGVLYVTMKEGVFEGFRESPHFSGSRRYFSLYEKGRV